MLDDIFAKLFPKKPKPATGPVDYIIAGLGNPGEKYESTRHNAGFLLADFIAEKYGITLNQVRFKSYSGDGVIAGKKILILKPATFMNKSGEAVVEALNFHKLPIERLLVLVDDIALPTGSLRIRRGGSAGGQNGLKNIIYLTGSDDFPRIRIGVGAKPNPNADLKDWVLSRFSREEGKLIEEVLGQAAAAIELIVNEQITQAMGLYNKRHIGGSPTPKPPQNSSEGENK